MKEKGEFLLDTAEPRAQKNIYFFNRKAFERLLVKIKH